VDICTCISMTPENNSRNEPDPHIQQDTQWLLQYRDTKKQLRGTKKRLSSEKGLDFVKKVRDNKEEVEDDLGKISRWLEATKASKEIYFKSPMRIQASLSAAVRELGVIDHLLNVYDNFLEERKINEAMECVRVLYDVTEHYKEHIDQALQEFRR
jgi:hypothetical protein